MKEGTVKFGGEVADSRSVSLRVWCSNVTDSLLAFGID